MTRTHLFIPLLGLIVLLQACATAEALNRTPPSTEFLELVSIIPSDAAAVPLGTRLDIALDAYSILFVTDPDHRRVLRFHAQTQRLESVSLVFATSDRLLAPQGIAIDPQGRMFITNPDLHELLVFDHSGTFLGGTGGFESPFDRPIDVAIDAEERLYVLDQTRRAVVLLERDGRVRQQQTLPPITGQFTRTSLTALAVAKDGTVYVTDTDAHQILRIAPDGAIHRFGTKGYEAGELISPAGIVADDKGEIIVSDAVNNTLYKFTADGRFVQEYVLYKPLLRQPSQLMLQGEHLWVVNAGAKQIRHFRVRQARTGVEHALLGEEFMALGHYKQAVTTLQTAISLGHDTAEVRFLLGLAYYDLAAFQQAIVAWQLVLQKHPDHLEALLQSGNAYAELGQYAQATEAYRQLLTLEPTHAIAYYNLGEAYFAQGDFTRAAQQFRQVLEISPTYAMAHLGLGRVFLEQQQYDHAETAFLQAMEGQSHPREAQHYLGITLFKADRLQQAIALLEKAASQGPHFTEALYYLGLAYAKAGMKVQAIATLQRVLALQPQHAGALRELARLR
jgi:tetratricopeptide (TPR) repeat protein